MGEAKQEEAKAEVKPEEKKEEKPAEEEKKDEKPAEEKKEAAEPGPPPPIVLAMELHCVGCAKKVERSILKCKGVEEVVVNMVQNQVTVKGAVDPQTLCSRIQKKTMKSVKILSPLPPAEGEATNPAETPTPQVSGVETVELLVNMHCEACSQQLRKKILKMRGVQAVETDLVAKKVTVTGTMDADQLVKYIHRRTGKLAKVIPPPPPPPPKEEEKKEEEEKKPEEKPEEKKEENAEEKKEEEKAPADEKPADGDKEAKKDGEPQPASIAEDDMAKKLAYMYHGGMINYGPMHGAGMMNYGPSMMNYGTSMMNYAHGIPSMMNYGPSMVNYGPGHGMVNEEDMGKRMVPWMPLYVVDRPPPPPQLFSDENPNACSIS